MVTRSGLGCISEGPWPKKILPNLNINNVYEKYEGKINVFTELTEGSLLGRKGFGEPRKENLSSGFSRVIHVIMSDSTSLIQLRFKGLVK